MKWASLYSFICVVFEVVPFTNVFFANVAEHFLRKILSDRSTDLNRRGILLPLNMLRINIRSPLQLLKDGYNGQKRAYDMQQKYSTPQRSKSVSYEWCLSGKSYSMRKAVESPQEIAASGDV